MNGFRSTWRQRNQRCRNKVNVQDFRLRDKGEVKYPAREKRVLDNILSRLSYIEKKLGLKIKKED